MQVSHSRIECFEQCPYKFKLRYIDELVTLPDTEPSNALYCGTAMHEGIEKGIKEGLASYFANYNVIDDLQINESIKIEYLVPKVQEIVRGMTNRPVFERAIKTPDFIGFIDLLVPLNDRGDWALYDFKYSNAVDRYMESGQLHEYKYFFEKANPYDRIVEMGFIFIPKTQIRQRKTEDLQQYRNRLLETLSTLEVQVKKVEYDPNKVIDFLVRTKHVIEATEYPKNETRLCDFCEFREYCQNGVDYMILPSTARRQIDVTSKKKVWLYGAPFSGKTTLADSFPTPLMLNTDGNTNSFSAPLIEIRETLEGRQKISAWENFNAAIDELQKGSEFKTIVVDLVEDTYEHCRRYCYTKLGIEHESDNSFKAWDYVRNEFLTTMKKLMTLDYNIVLISHEDMSKDITKRSGDKITSIRPNIQDKIANKLAGMVDIVARVVCDADTDERTLQFKSDSVVFGGGRLKIKHAVIPLSYDALCGVYNEQTEKTETTEQSQTTEVKTEPTPTAPVETTRRTRRVRTAPQPQIENPDEISDADIPF